jgi:membrane fusion protein, copper/silver efflux system
MNHINRSFLSKYSGILIGIIIGLAIAVLFLPSPSDQHSMSNVEESADETPTLWTCSMHPNVQQPEPGDCPICGMDLIPLISSGDDGESRQLKMSPAAMKLAEIQTIAVRREFVEHQLRLTGKVTYDETRLKYITAWFPGRLDRLFVDYTGTPVKQGDHLVEMYSPAIATDQEALLQALQASKTLSNSSVSQVQTSRNEMLNHARERLHLLGLTAQQIQDIEQRGAPSDRITFYSPINGVVIHKNTLQGDYVQTGTRIYTIADLSQVWIKMDAYESDLQWIHYGQQVDCTTVSYPGEVFQGRISFIDPFLNEPTRTIKVRVNIDNKNGKLKPGMFVNAIVRARVNADGEFLDQQLAGKWISPMHPEIIKDHPGTCDICGMPLVTAESLGYVDADKNIAPPLIIPDTAPLITGKRAVVYVKLPDTEKPTFEGREIVLGPRLKGHYIVKSGLKEGDQVVVKGNFKIDSALQIIAKPSMMSPPDDEPSDAQQPSDAMQQVPPDIEAAPLILPSMSIPDFLEAYKSIWTALYSDDLIKAQQGSHQWVNAAKKHSLKKVEMIGHKVMHASDIEIARQAFEQMSDLLIAAIDKHGSPSETLYAAHCPMAFDNKGAQWLQWDEKILNPYFGDAMLECGSINKTFDAKQNNPGQHNH